MLALQRVLRSRGVRTWAGWGNDAPIPERYAFLPGASDLTPLDAFPERPQVLVVLDCASAERLGSLQDRVESAGYVIVIDHHAKGRPFGDVRLVDPQGAATAVLVYELVGRLGASVDCEIATCLYVGLVTDTGRFAHASTTPEVMELGAKLIACDIDHAAINRRIWGTHSFAYLKLVARAMERAQLVPEASLVWTAVLQRDLVELGVAMDEAEGLVEALRSVDGCACSCICKEQVDGSWKVSLRGKQGLDVGRIAVEHGGGGHAAAAGFTAEGTLDEVVGTVVAALAPPRALVGV
jgi:phosphoesterase RecJ-like protein